MGILNRLNTLVRANVNELISGSSEPDRALERSLREMESSVGDARKQMAHTKVTERQLMRQWDDARDEALDWEDKAMEALRLGDEEIARDCLIMKRKLDDRAGKVREDLEQQRGYLGDLERSLDAVHHKIESVRGRRRRVDRHISPEREERRAARRSRRSTGMTLPFDSDDPVPSFDDGDHPEEQFGLGTPFRAFEALGERIESRLAGAESELSEDPLADKLSARFESLENQRDLRNLRARADKEEEPDSAPTAVSDLRRKLLEELEG
jgi:phage shock protein A